MATAATPKYKLFRVFMFSPPLSDSEGSVRNARIAVHDRARPHFVLWHNAHTSDRFAKATNVVEKNSFLAPRLK
jgi:hypothetical protein